MASAGAIAFMLFALFWVIESSVFGRDRPKPTPADKITLARRDALDPGVVEAMFDEIALLVLEGDAAGLAAKVAELSAARPAAQETGEAPAVRIVP
jgi:hypothetical protein